MVVIHHDESIYNTNEGQPWMCGEDDDPAILPKTNGSVIMVSDFVEDHNGCLSLNTEEHSVAKVSLPSIPRSAPVLFEYGADKEGYWTGDRFMVQVKTACGIAEAKYDPSKHTFVFKFDQRSCDR